MAFFGAHRLYRRRSFLCSILTLLAVCRASAVIAHTAPAAKSSTPRPSQVIEGNRIVWRVSAPAEAKNVQITMYQLTGPKNFDLHRGSDGVWSAATEPMPPDLYEYHFTIDGVNCLDPVNPWIKDRTNSLILIRGNPANVWDDQRVPHGVIHIHFYQSHSLGGITRRMHVYTPPGYEANSDLKYPVLYLLHGSGDDDAGWTDVGRANVIIDNLIHEGKAKPFVCVMPFGHTPDSGPAGHAEPGHVGEPFGRDLLEDVMPLIESHYRVYTDAPHTALVGLSMGGSQTIRIGLTHLDRFAWLCPMSAGHAPTQEILAAAPQLKSDPQFANQHIKLFWMACGDSDKLLSGNQETDQWLSSLGIHHEFHVMAGVHTWPLWRRNLAEISAKLFQQ